MARFTHLSLSERIRIQTGLSQGERLGAIARSLGRDRRSIAREIRSNRTFVYHGAYAGGVNNCAHRKGCTRRGLCTCCFSRRGLCHLCGRCNERCPDFEPAHCPRLEGAPFCCNGCPRTRNCSLKRFVYNAEDAHRTAVERLSAARRGISLTPEELMQTDRLVSPLLKNGQSVHHIYMGHKDELFCSERSLYTHVDNGLLAARNLDLRRKVRHRPPRKKLPRKVDKACRTGRTFADFCRFTDENPDLPVVQMDTVEGSQDSRKVLLTLLFPQTQFLLAFIRDHNTARSVTEVFDRLEASLGNTDFRRLFPVLLTDNGTEFSDPAALEKARRTRVFYCDPMQSNQKSRIERAHEFIRYVCPKGSSLDALAQPDIDLLCAHINSYRRDNLAGKSPLEAFGFLYGKDILQKLNVRNIKADEVLLTPRLLRKPQ